MVNIFIYIVNKKNSSDYDSSHGLEWSDIGITMKWQGNSTLIIAGINKH